jgi:hypothetical protein
MGLMDAKEYDPRPARRRWRIIIAVAALIVVPLLTWRIFFYYWPEKHVVDRFFQALEQKDFETAYGIYVADPDWKQHPQKYNDYSLSQFKLDWGPSSEYGLISSHKIECVKEPPKKNFASSSGVIVNVILNGRSQETSMWVEKKTKTLTLNPGIYELQCHPPR